LGSLQQWNPTKVFIDFLAIFGLVGNRKRGHRMWNERKLRMQAQAQKEGKRMVEKLSGPPLFKIRTIHFEEDVQSDTVRLNADSVQQGSKSLDGCDENIRRPDQSRNDSGVSAGHLDRIESVEEWEKAAGGLTKEKVMKAIPAQLKKRCALTSSLYLMRSLVYLFMAYKVFYTLQCVPIIADHLQSSVVSSAIFWGTWALVQGTIATGVWVVGHECGHGAFSESPLLNDIIGFILHTLLLVPYFAWQFTHGKHHKFTNHTTMGETHVPSTKPTWLHKMNAKIRHLPLGEVFGATVDVILHLVFGWPLYLVLNFTGGRTNWRGERLDKKKPISHYTASGSEIFPPQWHRRINMSTAGSLAMMGGLSLWVHSYGFSHMFKWYFAPYLVVNAWLVLYTWMHHTHEDVPHFGTESFNWLRGALCTIDRPYPALINHLHLHIGSTHVMHHLNSFIPHYHAEAATECVKPLLGSLYRFDARPITTALISTSKRCEWIENVNGVQLYRSQGMNKRRVARE